jgi:hypothetical protein
VEEGCKLATAKIHDANGIAGVNDTFYVANSLKGTVTVLERQTDNSLVLTDVIPTGKMPSHLYHEMSTDHIVLCRSCGGQSLHRSRRNGVGGRSVTFQKSTITFALNEVDSSLVRCYYVLHETLPKSIDAGSFLSFAYISEHRGSSILRTQIQGRKG